MIVAAPVKRSAEAADMLNVSMAKQPLVGMDGESSPKECDKQRHCSGGDGEDDYEQDLLGFPYKRDYRRLLFDPRCRLYVYGQQQEAWWFCERANRRHPDSEPARRLTSNSTAAACGLSEYKLAADLAREFLHMVDAQAPIANSAVARLSTEYGHRHQLRVAHLVSQVLFNHTVPLYEIGFAVNNQDETHGASPDYLCMPFRVAPLQLDSRGRGVILEVKTSARQLLATPHVEHIVQMHQQMTTLDWRTDDAFGLLAAYHQDALTVWRVPFERALWEWVQLRCDLFLHIVNAVGAPHAYDVVRQCRLLHNVARDTHTYWFDRDPSRQRCLPLQRVHVPSAMHRVELAYLDKAYPGWRLSAEFSRKYLSQLPPVRPNVQLVYMSAVAYDSTDDDKRDAETGLVKPEYWRHSLPLVVLPLANADVDKASGCGTASPSTLAEYRELFEANPVNHMFL